MVLVYAEVAGKSACLGEKAFDSGKIIEKRAGNPIPRMEFPAKFQPKGTYYFFLDFRRVSFKESRAF